MSNTFSNTLDLATVTVKAVCVVLALSLIKSEKKKILCKFIEKRMYVGNPINSGNYSAFCKPYTLA